MSLSEQFHGKPSEFIAQFIAALRNYKKDEKFEFELGKDYCARKGAYQYISESAAMLMWVTNKSFDEIVFNASQMHREYEDYNRFMYTADWVGTGVPWYLFQYLGIEDKYVHPDRWWVLIDGSWKEHITHLEAYWLKLNELGL